MKKNNYLAYISAIVYSLITGLSFLFTKIALEFANPIDILAHRFTASFIVVIIILLLKNIKLNYNKEKLKKVIPLGLLYPFLFFSFQTFGLQISTSLEAGILLATAPIFTLILAAIFLKEKTSLLQKVSVIVSVIGVIYIVINKESSIEVINIRGTVLLVLSALSFAMYSVRARKLTQEFNSTKLSYVMIIIGFITFSILSLGSHMINGTITKYIEPLRSGRYIVSVLYLGVLSSLVTSILTNYTLSKIEASRMSVFSNLSTIVSILAGVIFLKEDIYLYHIIGSAMIILGVLGTNFLGKSKNTQ